MARRHHHQQPGTLVYSCGEKMSMSLLLTHESTIIGFDASEAAAYGAVWLVVTITSSPARLHAANARSSAATSSSSPSVLSTSKHTPSKPAALIWSRPSLLAYSSSRCALIRPFLFAPPTERNCRPW